LTKWKWYNNGLRRKMKNKKLFIINILIMLITNFAFSKEISKMVIFDAGPLKLKVTAPDGWIILPEDNPAKVFNLKIVAEDEILPQRFFGVIETVDNAQIMILPLAYVYEQCETYDELIKYANKQIEYYKNYRVHYPYSKENYMIEEFPLEYTDLYLAFNADSSPYFTTFVYIKYKNAYLELSFFSNSKERRNNLFKQLYVILNNIEIING
jgi:nitroimidazol reductase NimA-like FMN-containing flavoprotein (pyridoxamine 5'-phosphate oxidase superfamily)